MEAVQKDHWYFMVLLIFLPLCKVAVQQRAASATVPLEEGMVLECLCPWEGNLSMVSWTKAPERSPIAVFHPEFGVAFAHHYRERIQFLRTTPMDGSITMTNITHQDIGLYHCSIQTFPQGSWTRDTLVDDLDEAPGGGSSEETPAPEVIEADAEVVAEPSDNLTISCNHEHNGTVYQVIMEKLAHSRPWGAGRHAPVGIMGLCRVVNGGLLGEDYTSRGRVNCTDRLDVSLQLTNVAEEDGGFYRCQFTTDAGVQTTTVLLTVPSPGEFSLDAYMMYIYVGAGVAGLLLFVVILTLALRNRKMNKKKEYRVKLHPFQRQANHYANDHIRDRMERRPWLPKNSPVYANVQTIRQQAKAYK